MKAARSARVNKANAIAPSPLWKSVFKDADVSASPSAPTSSRSRTFHEQSNHSRLADGRAHTQEITPKQAADWRTAQPTERKTPRKCGAVMSPPNKEGATPARKRGEGGAPQALPPPLQATPSTWSLGSEFEGWWVKRPRVPEDQRPTGLKTPPCKDARSHRVPRHHPAPCIPVHQRAEGARARITTGKVLNTSSNTV